MTRLGVELSTSAYARAVPGGAGRAFVSGGPLAGRALRAGGALGPAVALERGNGLRVRDPLSAASG